MDGLAAGRAHEANGISILNTMHRPGGLEQTDRHPSSCRYMKALNILHGSACSPSCYFVPCFVPRQRHPGVGFLPGFVFLLTGLSAHTFKKRAKWRIEKGHKDKEKGAYQSLKGEDMLMSLVWTPKAKAYLLHIYRHIPHNLLEEQNFRMVYNFFLINLHIKQVGNEFATNAQTIERFWFG